MKAVASNSNIFLLLFVFIVTLDSYLTIVILASVSSYFVIGPQWAVWFLTIYSLFYALSQPVAGKLIKSFGYRKMLLVGVSCSIIGASLSMLAPNFWVLLLFRTVSAIGAGIVYPTVISFINYNVPPERKGVMFGLTGFVFSLSAIVTPLLVGLILNISTWHLTMLLVVIPSIFLLGYCYRMPKETDFQKQNIDYYGVLTLISISLLLMLGLSLFDSDLGVSLFILPITLLILSTILIFVFVKIEKKAKDPVLDLRYFKNRNLLITFSICILFGILFSASFLIPIHAETVFNINKGTSATLMAIFAIGMSITSILGGVLVDRWNPRIVILIGLFISLFSVIALSVYTDNLIAFLIMIVIFGLGSGMMIGSPLNYIVSQEVPASEMGTITGILNIMRTVGLIIGPMVFGIYLNANESSSLGLVFVYVTAGIIAIIAMSLALLITNKKVQF